MCIDGLHKARTICTICQTCASPDIWITDKLACIIHHCLTTSGSLSHSLSLFLCFPGRFFCLRSQTCFLFFSRFCIRKSFFGICACRSFHDFFCLLLSISTYYYILRIHITCNRTRFNLRPFSDWSYNFCCITGI